MLWARATLHVSALHISTHHRSAHDLYAADLFPTTFTAIAVVTVTLANRNADQEDQHTQRDKQPEANSGNRLLQLLDTTFARAAARGGRRASGIGGSGSVSHE